MDFLTLVSRRQSDRKYTDRKIENDKLERCLEAARLAPSATNSQPWSFIVITDSELKTAVAKAAMEPLMTVNKFTLHAPVIVAIIMEKPNLLSSWGGHIKRKEYPLIDIGIAAEHLCLQATEEGLGSCMVGWFNEKKVKTLLGVSEDKNIPLLVTLGYTPENYLLRKKSRKSLQEIVQYNSYGKR